MNPLRILLTAVAALFFTGIAQAADSPNILWITSEDNGPELGCYGDSYSVSPHLDALAAKGMRYTNCISNAPVCAPARTTIITGVYPPSTGSEHMRSMTNLPADFKMYPQFMQEAGYYCVNVTKEDYNLQKPEEFWDGKKGKNHWRNREDGQPFFAIFNYTISHESRIRNEIEPENQIHDPALARVPAYHPDTPEVRKDWAQYYDRITMMDVQCGQSLDEVKEAGLDEDTIVFYYGDHGSGMPRSKRWPYNSGLAVPLIVYFPEKWKHLAPKDYEPGGTSDRLVGFVDLAPTLLSLTGQEPPAWMQGHAFAGKYQTPEQEYSFGFRGRMDERYDLVRTVKGKRYIYIRNYMPHRIYGQYIAYMFQTPTTQVWHDLYHAGKLNEAQSHFWEKKPAEELYDLATDPDEVHNLADSPDHQEVLKKMRAAHQAWEKEIRDVGFLPEAEIHSRSEGSSPYEVGHDPAKYDFDAIFAAANLATSLKKEDLPEIVKLLGSPDSAVRYWGAIGLLCHEEAGVAAGRDALLKALGDDSASVQIMAAETLGRFSTDEDAAKALDVLLSHSNQVTGNTFEAILAVNALDYMDERALPRLEEIKALPAKAGKDAPERMGGYVGNLLPKVISDLERNPK